MPVSDVVGWAAVPVEEVTVIDQSTPAAFHRAVAGPFTQLVRGAADWEAPAPVEGWAARDVVRHLAEWFPEMQAP